MDVDVILTRFRWTFLAIWLILAGCSEKPQVPNETYSQRESTKNLLLICIDTVRADVFYKLGEGRKDALSAWQDSALIFEQAVAPGPWTVPSIASVLTGLWAEDHGAGKLPGLVVSVFRDKPAILNKGVPLFAESAQKAGFRTTVVSASGWTLGPGTTLGYMSGFEESFPFETPPEDTDWKPLVAKLTELLKQQAENTSNLYFLHLMDAHNMHWASMNDVWLRDMSPKEALEPYLHALSAQQRAHYLEIAPPGICEDEQSVYCKLYLIYTSGVSATRDAIAATLETLQEEGLLDDTVVIVFSDHGEEFGDHAEDGRLAVAAAVPYFGHGQSLYQELIHVPLMIWHPEYEGMEIKQPVSLVDIAPTAARWLDFDFLPDQWSGRYLDDYLHPAAENIDRVIYASGISGGEIKVSAQQGIRKSIWNLVSDQTQYYDLATDPHELNSESTDKLVLHFDGLFLDHMLEAQDNELETGLLSEEQIRRLRSIGYLQGVDAGADIDTDTERD
jgi:arylsulfatase A-like enzyme